MQIYKYRVSTLPVVVYRLETQSFNCKGRPHIDFLVEQKDEHICIQKKEEVMEDGGNYIVKSFTMRGLT
jgi:hypothetical protein